MNVAEKITCQRFLRPQVEISTDSAGGSTSHPAAALSLVERVQLACESADIKSKRISKYIDTIFVSRTSNICEQVFSKAKHIMTPSRQRMDLLTLETILFLKVNEDLWNEETI